MTARSTARETRTEERGRKGRDEDTRRWREKRRTLGGELEVNPHARANEQSIPQVFFFSLGNQVSSSYHFVFFLLIQFLFCFQILLSLFAGGDREAPQWRLLLLLLVDAFCFLVTDQIVSSSLTLSSFFLRCDIFSFFWSDFLFCFQIFLSLVAVDDNDDDEALW